MIVARLITASGGKKKKKKFLNGALGNWSFPVKTPNGNPLVLFQQTWEIAASLHKIQLDPESSKYIMVVEEVVTSLYNRIGSNFQLPEVRGKERERKGGEVSSATVPRGNSTFASRPRKIDNHCQTSTATTM